MLDLHSHILPGVDDGAPDADVSIEMAGTAVADGIQRAREAALAGKVDETRALLAVVHERLGTDTLCYRVYRIDAHPPRVWPANAGAGTGQTYLQ